MNGALLCGLFLPNIELAAHLIYGPCLCSTTLCHVGSLLIEHASCLESMHLRKDWSFWQKGYLDIWCRLSLSLKSLCKSYWRFWRLGERGWKLWSRSDFVIQWNWCQITKKGWLFSRKTATYMFDNARSPWCCLTWKHNKKDNQLYLLFSRLSFCPTLSIPSEANTQVNMCPTNKKSFATFWLWWQTDVSMNWTVHLRWHHTTHGHLRDHSGLIFGSFFF